MYEEIFFWVEPPVHVRRMYTQRSCNISILCTCHLKRCPVSGALHYASLHSLPCSEYTRSYTCTCGVCLHKTVSNIMTGSFLGRSVGFHGAEPPDHITYTRNTTCFSSYMCCQSLWSYIIFLQLFRQMHIPKWFSSSYMYTDPDKNKVLSFS